MEPIKPQPTFKVYAVIKQTGLNLTYVYGAGSNVTFGPGFYGTREEAEQFRTLEILKNTDTGFTEFHVFELEIPNPVYRQ